MRMWMVPPILMCLKHISAEHNEIHKHRPLFVKHHSIAGRRGQTEPLSMKARHDELAKYLHHNSPYILPDLSYLPKADREMKVDRVKSYRELIKKCPECRAISKGARVKRR